MARPESQAVAGYFPTPEYLLPSIAALVAIERERYERPLILDPCAGTGSALVALAAALLDLAPADAARHCQGIELEATRAEALARRLPHGGARHGDAFTFGIGAAPGASVLFLNPPYDFDREHRRLEQRFLARFTEALAPGGALLFVVPHAALAASAELLASSYEKVGVWRFPEPDFEAFRQVVVVAERRREPGPPDRLVLHRLGALAATADGAPILGVAEAGPAVTVRVPHAHLTLHAQALDVEDLLAHARPFEPSAAVMGFDRDARELLGAPLPVALPPRPAHIALALAAGLLNGRRLAPNDSSRHPVLLAKGTFTRTLQTVDQRRNRDGVVTGEVCVQQPRLDLHILRLDTLTFQQLALGTEPSEAESLDGFNTADLLEHYSASLARLVREQLPALHDPDDSDHQIDLPALARRPYRRQAALIQAGLKLLARGENPQLLAEVGTGKSTVALSIAGALAPERFARTAAELVRVGLDPSRLRPVSRTLIVCPPHLLQSWTDQARAVLPEAAVQIVQAPSDLDRPAAIYVLSRETAKLGSSVAGVASTRCPDCGHPLPDGGPETFAAQRLRCNTEVAVPANPFARLARDLGLALQRSMPESIRERLVQYLEAHPAAHRRAVEWLRSDASPQPLSSAASGALRCALDELSASIEERFLRVSHWEPGFWEPFRVAASVALALDVFDAFATRCRELAGRRMAEADPGRYLQPIDELVDQITLSSNTPGSSNTLIFWLREVAAMRQAA